MGGNIHDNWTIGETGYFCIYLGTIFCENDLIVEVDCSNSSWNVALYVIVDVC